MLQKIQLSEGQVRMIEASNKTHQYLAYPLNGWDSIKGTHSKNSS